MAKTNRKKAKVKRVKLCKLELTLTELTHLRDMFSVMLPPDMKSTISEMLAATEGRQLSEGLLWEKIKELCEKHDLPTESEAPDYGVVMTALPEMTIVPLQHGIDVSVEEREEDGLEPEKEKEAACQ